MLSKFLKSKFCQGLAYLLVIGLIFPLIPTAYAKEELRTLKLAPDKAQEGAATNLEEAIKGGVTGVGPDKAWIDLGTTQGLEDGMELQLKREGKVIGVVKVRKASEYSSEVEPLSLERGMEIKIGDEVVSLPPKKEVTTKEKEEPKEKITPPQKDITTDTGATLQQVLQKQLQRAKKDVTTDTALPILIITTMVQGIITSQEEIEIKGKVEEGTIVSVNDLPAKVDEKGEFATKVKLSPGKNKITVVAKDKAGNQKEEVMELTQGKKKKGFNKTLVYGALGAGLLAVLLSGGGKGEATPTGKIDISSIPVGAKIYIDNKDTAEVTPSLVESVEVGTRTVKLTKSDYKDWEDETVEVGEGQTTPVSAILELDSEPPVPPPFRK